MLPFVQKENEDLLIYVYTENLSERIKGKKQQQ